MSNPSKHINKTEREVPPRLRFYPQFPMEEPILRVIATKTKLG